MPESDNLNFVPAPVQESTIVSRSFPVGNDPVTTQHRANIINDIIREVNPDTNYVSDGYHTFGEVYQHRIMLMIAFAYQLDIQNGALMADPEQAERVKQERGVWRSLRHSDGELAYGGGWMVLGIGKQAGRQITYHFPESYWNDCSFAEDLDQAPTFDGHHANDTLNRLRQFYFPL